MRIELAHVIYRGLSARADVVSATDMQRRYMVSFFGLSKRQYPKTCPVGNSGAARDVWILPTTPYPCPGQFDCLLTVVWVGTGTVCSWEEGSRSMSFSARGRLQQGIMALKVKGVDIFDEDDSYLTHQDHRPQSSFRIWRHSRVLSRTT